MLETPDFTMDAVIALASEDQSLAGQILKVANSTVYVGRVRTETIKDAVIRLGAKQVRQMVNDGTVEVAPLDYMRGRTISRSFVVVDEAQNMTFMQIKMLLTRLGWHSTMVITGDPDQSDLLPGVSGLADTVRRLEALEGIAIVRLTALDVVRHPLVAAMMPMLA